MGKSVKIKEPSRVVFTMKTVSKNKHKYKSLNLFLLFFIDSYHSNIVCGFFNDHSIWTVKWHSFLFDQGPVFGFDLIAETHTRHSALNQYDELKSFTKKVSYLSLNRFNGIFHVILVPFLAIGILSNAWILHRTRKLEFAIDENFWLIFVFSQSIMKFNIFFISGETRIFRIKLLKHFFSVTVILVTSICWRLNDNGNFKILATASLCLCWWIQCEKSVTNMSKLSSSQTVSNIRHQYWYTPPFRLLSGHLKFTSKLLWFIFFHFPAKILCSSRLILYFEWHLRILVHSFLDSAFT